MTAFFVFSDEAGEYKKDRTEVFLRNNPYYIRATIIMDSADWINLRNSFYDLKKKKLPGLAIHQEVKWSYIWSIYKHKKNNENIPKNKPYYFLKKYDYKKLLDFVEQALKLLETCKTSCIIYTITINDRNETHKIEEKKIIGMHLQTIM